MTDENRYEGDWDQNQEKKYDIQPLIDDDTDLPHDQIAQDEEDAIIARDEEYAAEVTPTARNEENAKEATSFRDEEIASGIASTARNEENAKEATSFRDEETAAEVAPNLRERQFGAEREYGRVENEEQLQNIEAMDEAESSGTGIGWIALVLSIVSLFFLPLLTASIGVITGFFAHRNGARTLGVWAIVVGLFSIVISLFFNPFI